MIEKQGGKESVRIANMLIAENVKVLFVESCDEALNLLCEWKIKNKALHHVIMDSSIHDMLPEKFVKIVRENDKISDPYLVYLMDNDGQDDRELIKSAGFNYCFQKPLSIHAVKNILNSIYLKRQDECKSTLSDDIYQESTTKDKSKNNIKILLAEDNEVNQELAIELLHKLGYTVDVAWDGIETIKLCSERSYDLILMDWQMPRMDGIKATKEIKKGNSKNNHTPIIAMTARVMQGDKEKCLAAGMDDFIEKPIRKEFLLKAINKYCT